MKTSLRALREKSGYSQTDFADVIGVSRMSISLWERGDRKPSQEHIDKICSVLGCKESTLGFHGFRPTAISIEYLSPTGSRKTISVPLKLIRGGAIIEQPAEDGAVFRLSLE